MRLIVGVCSLSLLWTANASPVGTFQARCEDFGKRLHTYDLGQPIVVNIAEYLPAGTVIDRTAEGGNASCAAWVAPPIPVSVCRVNLRIPTSSQSSVEVEVWLPEQWTGRVLTIGNGGFGGCKSVRY